ncbi:nuclear protein DGCR14 [Suillus subaureus]|uniref:Nuclear protein DGCR14 n=1 Tax=Suillus subaureus TaxID=48587 RepID=A0A9P7JJN5_9AGAM|nr:nuclear protein DGCR14 [Suillus subaureus]KAG1826061.1 nuclear protein DGCR14 [Suillus subaureus]
MSTPGPSESSRSLNSQQVLEEDEYTAALSHIIARDFFPSLVHLDATNEYLDAVSSRDPHLINASVRRLQEVNSTPTTYRGRPWQTPSMTPYGAGPSETPLRTPHGDPVTKRPRYSTDMSLDNFQARYTSEDNASFTQIMDEENRKRKERWGWAWEAQKRVEDQRDKMIEARERMMIEPAQATGVREKFVIEAPTVAGLITQSGESLKESEGESQDAKDNDKGKGKEVTIFNEEDEPMDVMAPRKDTRPAGVDGWNFKARNSLMFSPDADMSPYHRRTSKAKASDDLGIITHVNTRLQEQDEGDSQSRAASAPPSPTRSRIDAAITGTPYRPRSPTNDFSLVPSLPSPTAAELGPSAVNQLMTWGTLNATPRVLSKSDDPAEVLPLPSTPFHIAAPSSREALSHKLSAHASKSLRAKAVLLGGPTPIIGRTPARGGSSKPGSMGPPSWTPRRADAPGNLTPAGKRLLDRTTMGTAAARRAEAMGRMDLNRVRWTPTPTARGG